MSKVIFYIFLTITCLILLFSCYPLKKASKQLDKAYDNYPGMVAEKTRQWFPCTISDSTTDTTFVNADSIIYLKNKVDSLQKVKQRIKDSIAIRYKDSCRTVTDNFDAGFNIGYEVGVYNGRLNALHDTIFIRKFYTIKDSAELFIAQENLLDAKKVINKLNNKINSKNTWLKVIGFGALMLLLILLFIIYSITKKV